MIKKILYGILVLFVLGLIAFLALYANPDYSQRLLLKPGEAFDAALVPPAPDYGSAGAWAALPDVADNADVVPPESGFTDDQGDAQVDVFFIHPTTYYQKDGWNAAFDEDGATRSVLEDAVLRYQASAYNGSARVFAPRYRQATLYSFLGDEPDTYAALTFAYEDVKRAFTNFIETRNGNRPFILASHSQGSLHGMKLLQEEIAGTPLANRLVAAYLIGYAIPEDLGAGFSACENENQTGCYLNWNSLTADADTSQWTEKSKVWVDGTLTPIAGRNVACVNPLTGALGANAEEDTNHGALPLVIGDSPLEPLVSGLTGAACVDGLLIVELDDDVSGFSFGVRSGDYHLYDYNLFYANIREDVARRVSAFWKL